MNKSGYTSSQGIVGVKKIRKIFCTFLALVFLCSATLVSPFAFAEEENTKLQSEVFSFEGNHIDPDDLDAFHQIEYNEESTQDLSEVSSDEILVVLDPNASLVSLQSEGAPLDYGLEGMEVVEEILPAEDGEGQIVSVKIPTGETAESAVEEIKKNPEVIHAQPNYYYYSTPITQSESLTSDECITKGSAESSSLVNDPYCNNNSGYNTINQYYLFNSETISAWDYVESREEVTVAVIDSGCRLDHLDIQGVVDAENAYDTYHDAPLLELVNDGTVRNGDFTGHGTHVAGIVGAQVNNGIGIAGASYSAKILPIKVFDDKTSTATSTASTTDILKAFDYLKDLVNSGKVTNLRVINMSLGGYTTYTGTDSLFQQEIVKMRNDYGVLTVCSGGNGESGNPRTDFMFPSDFAESFSVTSLDRDGGNSYWSDYNKDKDISAPGTNIYSLSNVGVDNYVQKNGTSMAAPIVSGAAALLWAANPNLSVDEVVALLENTAEPVMDASNDRREVSGSHGALNTQAAVAQAGGNGVYYLRQGDDFNTLMNDLTGSKAAIESLLFYEDGDVPQNVNLQELPKVSVELATRDHVLAYWDSENKTVYIVGSSQIALNQDSSSIFEGFTSLSSLDLSMIDSGLVENAERMFADCSGLSYLNLVSFDTSHALNMEAMFLGASAIQTLLLGEAFTFQGAGNTRFDVELYTPVGDGYTGMWTNGTQLFLPDEIPNNIQGTYTPYNELKGFSITYVLNGGVNAETNPLTYSSKSESIVLSSPTYPGYLFEGWYETEDFSGDPVTSIPSGSMGDKVFYAKWKEVMISRLGGETALDTMQKIVEEGKFDTGTTVILATSAGYWDALTASGAAGLYSAPVVLTDSSFLTEETKNTLDRLSPTRIIVSGGEAAIAKTVEDEIKARYKITPERLYGSDSLLTAVAMYESAGGWSDTAIIATAGGYWDALSAASIAYSRNYPIFLSDPHVGLPQEALDAMKSGGITNVLIVGGSAAVSFVVDEQLSSIDITVTERFSGIDAAQTSDLLASYAVDKLNMTVDGVGVATMDGYWDALSGASLCGKADSVLVLVNDSLRTAIDGVIARNADSIGQAYIFGGYSAVSQETEYYLQQVLGLGY